MLVKYNHMLHAFRFQIISYHKLVASVGIPQRYHVMCDLTLKYRK